MTEWVLFVVVAFGDSYSMTVEGKYESMEHCMLQREAVVESIGRPLINYQVVCVRAEYERG